MHSAVVLMKLEDIRTSEVSQEENDGYRMFSHMGFKNSQQSATKGQMNDHKRKHPHN